MSQVVLETLIEPLEARFEFKGSEDGQRLWRQDCFTRFSGYKTELVQAGVQYLIANRQYRTLPTIGEINKAISEAAASKPQTKTKAEWKKRLEENAEFARQFGNDFVTKTPVGTRAREGGWCRSCADHARGVAREYLIRTNQMPSSADVTFNAAELKYFEAHGQAFNDVQWKAIGGSPDRSKAMQGDREDA